MIRVLIVDNIRVYREGLVALLERESSIAAAEIAAHQSEYLDRIKTGRPDIVVLRTSMPECVSTIRSIADAGLHAKIVALDVSEADDEIIDLAEAGVAGYLLREGSLEDLIKIMHSVVQGECFCPPRVTATLLKRLTALAGERGAWKAEGPLTRREREVVALIDKGMSNKEIAQCLTIDVRTVKNHVHNILEKLQVQRRGQVAARIRGQQIRFAL
jgi:DNA-binding NarL/FixJ family response regulator